MSNPIEACCMSFCISSPESMGEHHHKMCPNYATKKHPYLFYYEEAVNAWIPAPSDLCGVIEAANLFDGETAQIEFKRVDLTDKEYDELLEA